MPTTTSKKADGAKGTKVVLNDTIFSAKIVQGLMHSAVRAEAINSRQETRDTKTRAEVAGGGRKPYKQKGTGRARQGSISAPHYRHGGIVFGPHPRNLDQHLPKKARRVALLSALSTKAAAEEIVILDSIQFDAISTKTAAALLKKLELSGKVLIVLSEHNPTIYKSFRNIPGIAVRVAPAFSVRDVLDTDTVLIVRGALDTLDTVYGKAEKSAEPVNAAEPVKAAKAVKTAKADKADETDKTEAAAE
jgi:large subunit ribosomal protein L4